MVDLLIITSLKPIMIKERKNMWEKITEENYPETPEEQDRTMISYVICGERVYLGFNECRLGWSTMIKDEDLDAMIFKVPRYEDDIHTDN